MANNSSNSKFSRARWQIVPGVGILSAWGDTVPEDGAEGFATGCLFQHTDGGDGTALYVNEGTKQAADFNAVTVGA